MFRIVIPARYASTRLPGKPLLLLPRENGKPMLQLVHEIACRSGAAETIIATDDERILEAGTGFGARVVMTSITHLSGTDRIAEVAARAGWADSDIVVNLQGDEPLMPPELPAQVAAILEGSQSAAIATLATRIRSLEDYLSPNVVKVVADAAGRALYFSRAPIPWSRATAAAGLASQRGHGGARRHVGLYAYRVGALRRLSMLPPTPCEQIESLEQLRALENGLHILVADAVALPGPHVDTAEDYARVCVLIGHKDGGAG